MKDDDYVGAAWVFERIGSAYTQFGGKLTGTGSIGKSMQGHSVFISTDGLLLAVGAPEDDSKIGNIQ